MENNNNEKIYSHALPEALFPLFKSDIEYELINSVLNERFPEKKKILIMYKYLASRHLPKFVLFSGKLPYGIVIKRLPPEQAWNEVYCNKILSIVHGFDFDVQYHEQLGCISEKYLPGFDVLNLPDIFLMEEKMLSLIFFWLGKCACVAHVFGIGDRGHNERIHCKEIEDPYQLYSLTKRSEPVVNIDFENFLSKRLFKLSIDADEIALLFYSLMIQIPDNFLEDFNNFYNSFQNGFKARLNHLNDLWIKDHRYFIENLKTLFRLTPVKNARQIISIIKERATSGPNNIIFENVLVLIENAFKKFKILRNKEKEKAILKEKRRLLHYKVDE